MSLTDNLRAALGVASPSRGASNAAEPVSAAEGAPPGGLNGAALDWESVFGGKRDEDKVTASAAMKISAFYRAIDLRTDSLGKYPVSVRNTVTHKEAAEHYLGSVLWERPNEAMTPYSYNKLVDYQRLVLGNAYVWIYRNGAGRAVELLPLPPGTCQPLIEPGSGRLWYLATNPKTGQMYRLHPADLLHFKGFSTNGVEGESLLSHAARTLIVAANRDKYENSVYRNGGQPAGVLSTETDLSSRANIELPDGTKISPKDLLRREWERIHRGPDNAFRVAVLDNGLKYQAISMSNADQQFVENKSVTVEDIARFCGVPMHKLYTGKQSYNSNEANSLDYVVDTMHPTVVQYEQECSYKLLTVSERRRDHLWICINMMAELRADSKTRAEWYKAMRELGAYSVNEIRALEDEPEVPGGDVRLASLNFVPLEDFPELSRKRAENQGNGGSKK